MPRYLHVHWHHELPDEPHGATGDAELSEGLMPFPDEIAADPRSTVQPTDAEEVERGWREAAGP